VAEQVCRRPARRRGQQQKPDGEQRRQVEGEHQPEAHGGQDQQLQGQRDEDGLRLAPHAGEVAHRQRQPEAEHHQGERQRERDAGEW
jgi:hypothetical protein